MAQGQAVLADPPGIDATANLSEKDLRDIKQYDRIVQFRDAILSGDHPTVKPPPGLLDSVRSSSHGNSAAQLPGGPEASSQSQRSFSANAGPLTTQSSGSPGESATKRTYGPGSRQINPVLLEKSGELVRAEFHIQRQRLERALKEEVEQRRGLKQEKAEPLADHDLTDVLSRALTLVQATTTAHGPVDEPSVANDEAASDSFDDNTFYSSKHDTPESNLTSRVRNDSEEKLQQVGPERQPASLSQPTHASHAASNRNHEYQALPNSYVAPTQPAPSQLDTNPSATASILKQFRVPGLNNYTNGVAQSGQASHANTSADQSQSEDSGAPYTVPGGNYGTRNAYQSLDDAYVDTHPPSPLVRTHDKVPAAPQPAPAPSNAVEERLASGPDQYFDTVRGAPAQVAALRNEPIAVNSPESSPQSGKGSEKKKGKKKKRKADRQAPEEVMPYIKPEPRSPSPMNAPSHVRPNKRQRQSQRQANEIDQDVVAVSNNSPHQYEQRSYLGDPVQFGYGDASGHRQRAASTAVVGDTGFSSAYVNDRRLADGAYVRRQASPPRYNQRPPSAAYASRPVSQVMVDDGYQGAPRAYRDPYEGGRMSTRPEADPYVGQAMPPTRIIVDSFGREYIEPPRPAMRQSVAPGPSYGGEIVYERPPPHAISRHPGPAPYDDNRGVVYTRASSAYPGPRRVVTQPEYASQDYGRAREYSARPGPAPEYVQVMAPPERQHGVESSREYGPRAASVRPMEPVRYEMPREYDRMQSVRPEASTGNYAGAVYPDGRRETAQPHVMEYGTRPVEQPVYQHGYSARPVERYYDQQPARSAENIAFIERPRGATQEIVYTDDARREVYR